MNFKYGADAVRWECSAQRGTDNSEKIRKYIIEIVKTIDIEESGFRYKLIYSTSDYGAWARMYVIKIQWFYGNKLIQLDVENGTLIRDLVSPDGKYLLLIFQNNKKFADPSNCVVYHINGSLHKIICSPYLVSKEAIQYHGGDTPVRGKIMGASIREKSDGGKTMALGIYDPHEYHHTGACYIESREFDPETGEIGALYAVSLPLK